MSESDEGTGVNSQLEENSDKKIGRRKSSRVHAQGQPSDRMGLSNEDNESSIKTRLRTNSGTPKKLKKNVITGGNGKQLNKLYEAEGKSMHSFLNKQQSIVTGGGDDSEDSEVQFNSVSVSVEQLKNSNADDDVDISGQQFVPANLDKLTSVNATGGVDARSKAETEYLNTSAWDKVLHSTTKVDDNMQPKSSLTIAISGVGALQQEIMELEHKVQSLKDGSMEKMFLELRLNMKRDNVKMMEKIDNATASFKNEVKQLRETQTNMET